jgi:diguanylate cyclase (GGDEF)-like protein
MQEIRVAELFFLAFSLGALCIGLLTFGLLARDRRAHPYYWTVFVLLVASLVAIFFDTAVLIAGGIHENFPIAVQFSRLHEIATTAYIAVIPAFFSYTLPPTRWQREASRIATIIGATFFGIVVIVGFTAPDLFISVTTQSSLENPTAYTNSFGRGAEGPLFFIRDALLGITLLFSLVVAITSARQRLITGPYLLIVVGIIIGVLFGLSAVYANFFGRYPGPLASLPFSRVGAGLTIFTMLSVAAYVLQYVDQARTLERTNLELQHRRNRLAFLAYHDDQTQMLNKQAFIRDVELLFLKKRDRTAVAYLCDVDDFRGVTDSYGFRETDGILRTIANRLDDLAGNGPGVDAKAYRIEGDRFVFVVFDSLPASRLDALERELLETLGRPIPVDDREIYLTFRVGRSTIDSATDGVEELLRRMQHAVGEARRNHATLHHSTESFTIPEQTSHQIAQDIRRAIRREEFSLYYQPIVDRRGRVVAAEALIRWERMRPDQFIPVAEESGMIVELTHRVVELLFADIAQLLSAIPRGTIFFNVSARHIDLVQLPALIRRNIERARIPAESIGIEITETSFHEGDSAVTNVLSELRSLGCSIAIDDFGTGYSSLSYLKHLPADRIKIDRIFVRDVPESRADSALVDSVAGLGRKLGMSIVAEGVETRKQYEYLVTREIAYFQGYFFSTPLSVSDFVRNVAGAIDLER